jgi:hypothetical protein
MATYHQQLTRIELLKRLDSALTYDRVHGMLVSCSANEIGADLGDVVHCVRKLFREAVEMTDDEYEEIISEKTDRQYSDR